MTTEKSDLIVGLEAVKKVKDAQLLRARAPAILRVGTNTCAPWIPNNAWVDLVDKRGQSLRFYINELESFEIRVPEGTYDENTAEIETDQKR